MTYEGRMARGKENYEAKKFLENSETVAYVASLETTDVSYSDMKKADLIEAASKIAALKGDETKDDLIVILENKSDEVAEVA